MPSLNLPFGSCAIPMYPVTRQQGEVPSTSLRASDPQEVAEIYEALQDHI